MENMDPSRKGQGQERMDPSGKGQGEELKVHHQTDADEEDENVKQLQECSILYLSLQECLAQTNRDWKSCQLDVQALKACHERRNRDKGK